MFGAKIRKSINISKTTGGILSKQRNRKASTEILVIYMVFHVASTFNIRGNAGPTKIFEIGKAERFTQNIIKIILCSVIGKRQTYHQPWDILYKYKCNRSFKYHMFNEILLRNTYTRTNFYLHMQHTPNPRAQKP